MAGKRGGTHPGHFVYKRVDKLISVGEAACTPAKQQDLDFRAGHCCRETLGVQDPNSLLGKIHRRGDGTYVKVIW